VPIAFNSAHQGGASNQVLPFRSLESDDVSDLEVSLEYICMKDQTVFLSVTFVKATGQDLAYLQKGFSASFRQSQPPEVLRLQSTPRSYFQDVVADEDAWVNPAPEHKVAIENQSHDEFPDMPEGIEAELRRLDILKFHLAELEKEVKAQEKLIMKMWKDDFAQCKSIKCYILTAIAKAPAFVQLIADHFRHHSHIDIDFFRTATHSNCTSAPGLLIMQPIASDVSHDELDGAEADKEASVTTVTLTAPTSATPTPSESKEPDHHHHGPPWGTGPPPWAKPGSGPPPWAKPGGRPPWAGPNWKGGPPPWVHGWKGGPPPWHNQPGQPNNHHLQDQPDIFPTLTAEQIFKIRVLGGLVGLTVVVLFAGCVFTCIRFKAQIWCDPRCQVDIMALREEWKTRRAYRKAACKYRFREFLKRFRFRSKSDEEEKEAMLAPQDDVVVNREITNLRAAHQIVGEMMRAEEGQSRFAQRTRHARSSSESESLPSYRSGPPGYESGLDGEISVVDGFSGYTPSGTEDTPSSDSDSSIVDCSPRLSFETQRTF
jgi:hypothetical protein